MSRAAFAVVPAVVVMALIVALASCAKDRPPPASSLLVDDAAPATPTLPSIITLPTGTPTPDPETCEEAQTARSYVGCDYWPSVIANDVSSYFDYAVVLGNAGTASASVVVTGPAGLSRQVVIAPGTLEKILLPWVQNLKNPESSDTVVGSVVERGGAYHIVSSVPVVAYQFSPLEYELDYEGNAFSLTCAGDQATHTCFSYSNDASLLLPSTAWTQSYRITGFPAQTIGAPHGTNLVVTAASNATQVTLVLSPQASVVAGGGVPTTAGGGIITQTLDAGDVMELVSLPAGADFSGSLLTADKPVEVFTGDICIDIPGGSSACDHIEEAVLPAEALGNDYIITPPVGPQGAKGLHVVRFYGNRDGTHLSYAPTQPSSCPSTLSAGEVGDCGMLSQSFVVHGDQEFGVASFGVGASEYSFMDDSRGDPDQTVIASVLQFRTKYLFLAPDDYEESYGVVTGPKTAAPVVDGAPLTDYEEIENGYGYWHAPLAKNGGSHTLTSTQPVGLQVMGYAANTSYTYPGGLSLATISPAPPPPVVR